MSVLSSLSMNSCSLILIQALIRDEYRCVVTKRYDASSVRRIRELHERVGSDPSTRTEATQCAHIFAEFTNSGIAPGSAKVCPLFTVFLNAITIIYV